MIKRPQKGLTLVESVVTVAIVGGLVATTFLGYQLAIPKSQASEMSNMVSAQSLALFKNMQNGYCTKSGTTEQIQGKYGTLSVSGAQLKNKGETCPSGCKLNFTFNSTSHPSIKGKVLALDVLNNFKYTKGAGTTLDEKFITKTLIDGQTAVGENCTASTIQAPTTTDGEISGSEIGEAAPAPPTTPPTTPPTEPSTPPAQPVKPPTQGEDVPVTPPTPANLKWNVFSATINEGLSYEWGIAQYLYPLNMNNADDRSYFNGDNPNHSDLYKRIYYRTAYEWGRSTKAGYIRVNGSGQPHDLGVVMLHARWLATYVHEYARCPSKAEFASAGMQYSRVTCRVNQSFFTQYPRP